MQTWWVSERRCLVPRGGPGVQQFSRGGGGAHQPVELSCLCFQEVTEVQGRALCSGWAGQCCWGRAVVVAEERWLCRGKASVPLWHKCSWAQLWQQEMLLGHQSNASWKSCCVKSLEQVWHVLLQSKAGEGKEPVFPKGSITTSCNSLQLLAMQIPTTAGTYIGYFLPRNVIQLSCKCPALTLESRITFWWKMANQKLLCMLDEGGSPVSCSPCSSLQGTACCPWTGGCKPGQPWLFGNASCVLPFPASICCRLQWHPSHAGITWVKTIS